MNNVAFVLKQMVLYGVKDAAKAPYVPIVEVRMGYALTVSILMRPSKEKVNYEQIYSIIV